MELEILNTRDRKAIHEKLEEQYGFTGKLDYAFLKNENKGRIYIVSRDIANLNLDELKIDTLGLYFAGEDGGGNLRLTIEGSQLVGPESSKNIFELDDGLFKLWIAGHDIQVDEEWSPHMLMKHDDDFIGCGKIMDGKLKNFIPKSRRILNLM